MKYEIIKRADLTFNVEGQNINITHAQYKSGEYESLISLTKIKETRNGKPFYRYYWDEYWLDIREYCDKDLSMDYLIKECIAYTLCEDGDSLNWMHP